LMLTLQTATLVLFTGTRHMSVLANHPQHRY
jgi:hypothetical protein